MTKTQRANQINRAFQDRLDKEFSDDQFKFRYVRNFGITYGWMWSLLIPLIIAWPFLSLVWPAWGSMPLLSRLLLVPLFWGPLQALLCPKVIVSIRRGIITVRKGTTLLQTYSGMRNEGLDVADIFRQALAHKQRISLRQETKNTKYRFKKDRAGDLAYLNLSRTLHRYDTFEREIGDL